MTSGSGKSIASRQQPNRLTRVFGRMKEICPQHLQAYAACVLSSQQEGTLGKGSCEREFRVVKECFRTARLGR